MRFPFTNILKTVAATASLLVAVAVFPAGAMGDGGITVAAVGDIMMGSDYPSPDLPRNGGKWLFTEAAPFFKKADISMGNLEGPLTTEDEPAKDTSTGRSYLFRTPPSFAANLKAAGITMVSLANNHAKDFGRAGSLSTKRALREAGVAFSSKSGEVAEFTVRGLRVGIVSLSFGSPPRSIIYRQQALDEIATLVRRYDVLILSVHNGAEGRAAMHVSRGMEYFMNEPRGDLIRFAHDAIDRGVALVVGHGPHVPRALELYRGRLIAYSLGNFATFSGVNVAGENGYAPLLSVELAADGSFKGGEIHSFLQRRKTGPHLDPKQRALRLMKRLTAEDFPDGKLDFLDSGELRPR
ncbi:CapA family protein [Geomonas sp. Red32]|uniref:CapA family protein n=1 Tax=Geomonas sp. Red32 TaxID=2912856 RepID=UPI00202CF26C|nr:CapA family protein [Geomonas sp. Red32]MCM0084117.1 CapA family protein [Geomonas sp. Red32]